MTAIRASNNRAVIHTVTPNLYYIVHGVHPLAGKLLASLGLSTSYESTGRFRDCYLQRREDGALEIHLLTRNGGGNRTDFIPTIATLQRHPQYVRDFDEAFDSTFATFVFNLSSEWRAVFEAAVTAAPTLIPKPAAERVAKAIARLQNEPNHPESKRIAEALRPTMEALQRDAEAGVAVQGLLDADSVPPKLKH